MKRPLPFDTSLEGGGGDEEILTPASAATPKPKKLKLAPRERIPGLQKMLGKVSGTKQGTRIPGLGLVPDPEPDAETPQMTPPPTRSVDPFSSAQLEPLGLPPRQLAGIGLMGATGGLGLAGVGGAAGLGALGGAGMEVFGSKQPDAVQTGLGAATGGLGGALMGKVLPPVAKAIGSRLPNLTNDAKVGAEMLKPSVPGSPFDRAGTRITPTPRPDTMAGPPPDMTRVSGPPNALLRRPMNPMQTQVSGLPGEMTSPGSIMPPLRAPPIPEIPGLPMPGGPSLSAQTGNMRAPARSITAPGSMVPQQGLSATLQRPAPSSTMLDTGMPNRMRGMNVDFGDAATGMRGPAPSSTTPDASRIGRMPAGGSSFEDIPGLSGAGGESGLYDTLLQPSPLSPGATASARPSLNSLTLSGRPRGMPSMGTMPEAGPPTMTMAQPQSPVTAGLAPSPMGNAQQNPLGLSSSLGDLLRAARSGDPAAISAFVTMVAGPLLGGVGAGYAARALRDRPAPGPAAEAPAPFAVPRPYATQR